MKKLTAVVMVLLSSTMLHAQGLFNGDVPGIVEELTRAVIIFFGMFLIGSFILTVFRQMLDYRLKRRMLEKGVSDELATHFLRPTTKDTKAQIMKWFIIFLSIGAGFIFINLTLPLGIHSLAILCFCIAFGYLAYYFFLKRIER